MSTSVRRAPAPDPEPLVTAHYIMARTGCSRSWVQRHRAELGARKLGNLLLFERADVEAWIQSGRVAKSQPAPESEPTPLLTTVDTTGLPEKNPVTGEPWPWNQAADRRTR